MNKDIDMALYLCDIILLFSNRYNVILFLNPKPYNLEFICILKCRGSYGNNVGFMWQILCFVRQISKQTNLERGFRVTFSWNHSKSLVFLARDIAYLKAQKLLEIFLDPKLNLSVEALSLYSLLFWGHSCSLSLFLSFLLI